jgi:nucleoside-diphosphate-sugar epimerase
MSKNTSAINSERVLVTGASGYIGTNLCRKIVSMGAPLCAISRRKPPLDERGFKFVAADLTNYESTHKVMTDFRPNVVFHLAGFAAGGRDADLVLPNFHSNLTTTVNVLLAASETNVRRVILAGSLEEPDGGAGQITPSSPYAAAKWAASAYGRMFHRLYATPVVILRVFMTYGPGRQSPQKLIPWVVTSLLEGKAPELSSGERQIDWVFMDDVVEGMISAATAPGVEGDTIDIGTGKLTSIRTLVEKLVSIINPEIKPRFGVLSDRVLEQVRVADVERTHEKIGWKAVMTLDKGLERTVQWFRQGAT